MKKKLMHLHHSYTNKHLYSKCSAGGGWGERRDAIFTIAWKRCESQQERYTAHNLVLERDKRKSFFACRDSGGQVLLLGREALHTDRDPGRCLSPSEGTV